MMSMWMSLRTTQFLSLAAPDTSYTEKPTETLGRIGRRADRGRKQRLDYEDEGTQNDCRTYVSKYDAVLCGGHLDIGLNVGEIVRSQSERRRLLHQLEVTCRLDMLVTHANTVRPALTERRARNKSQT